MRNIRKYVELNVQDIVSDQDLPYAQFPLSDRREVYINLAGRIMRFRENLIKKGRM